MTVREVVIIDYTNWRGERRWRKIRPQMLYYGHTTFHPEDQHLLQAIDLEDNQVKQFAMKDIHAWSEVKP